MAANPARQDERGASPILLSTFAGYQTFGEYLQTKRNQLNLLQADIAVMLPTFSDQMYGNMERGRRAPQATELVPIFEALVELQASQHFPPIPAIEAETYFRLGKAAIEHKRRKREVLSPAQWEQIHQHILALVSPGSPESLHLVTPASPHEEAPDSRRRKALREALDLDVSLLLERDQWVEEAISQIGRTPAVKVSVYQGGMGAGKSHALALLTQRLALNEELYLIPYTFQPGESMTPVDQLDVFLATIYTDITLTTSDEITQRPLAERIDQTLKALFASEKRVVLLLDDAQAIFPDASSWAPGWLQFFEKWLASQHTMTMYVMTRTWPGWLERQQAFLHEDNLPDLSVEAAIEIWKRKEFTDVSDELLRAVCAKCGANPQTIEMLAFQYKRRSFVFALGDDVGPGGENTNTRNLKKLLASDTLFSNMLDAPTRRTLQQVFTNRFNGEERHLLNLLAVSPLPLPFHLLLDRLDYFVDAYEMLKNASFVDLNLAATHRAALVPLVREAVLQELSVQQKAEAEQEVLKFYNLWLQQGHTFQNEQEQAVLVSELAVLHLKQHQFLQVAELLVEYGWLSFLFGHGPRLARLAENAMRAINWRATAESEAGGLLLLHDLLARFLDHDLGNAARKQAYMDLFEIMMARTVVFHPQTVVHITHHKLRYLIGAKQFEEAWALSHTLCEQYRSVQDSEPLAYTELCDQRAYVLGRWGDYQDGLVKQDPEGNQAVQLRAASLAHWQEAADIHEQCAEELFRQERFASRLRQSRIRFKRARLLHDLAYYRRCAGQLEQAKQAMEACLKLKEASYAGKNSLAGSYGDYGQLLGQLGQYQDALWYSNRALLLVQQLLDEGDRSVVKQKGMLLVEKGKILLLLGRLEEAKALFLEGSQLVAGTARDVYTEHATEGLRQIEMWYAQNPRHQLDWRWYPRYHDLVLYDDIAWLAQAGPFSEEEQAEWEVLLSRRGDPEVENRLSALLVQSRRREIAASLAEPRKQEPDQEPCFHYPLIPLQEVRERRAGFEQLRAEIEQHEPNLVVRRLYREAINERLAELLLVEAAYQGDDQGVWEQSKRLAAPATVHEFQIALSLLVQRIDLGQQHPQAHPYSETLRQMLNRWQLFPLARHVECDVCTQKAMSGASQFAPDSAEAQTWFDPPTVQAFFEDIFRIYQFPWSVHMDEAATSARVDLDQGRLILPPKPMSLGKIRELLAHEVETHAFRSVSGAQSPLGLLSSGLGDFLPTEEGLASLYVQETIQRSTGAEPKPKMWIGTLACGLAAGVACPPLSFRELLLFIEQVSLLADLLDGKVLTPQLQEKARRYAENRCLRTFRGVTHLSHRGICSNKDTYYLRGFLTVCRELENNPSIFEQLMVGAVGVHHLADLAELGIEAPRIVHKHLATDPELDQYVVQFANQQT